MDPAHPRPPRNTNPFRLSMHLHTVYVNTDDADDPTHTVHSILFTCPFDFFFFFLTDMHILIDNVPLLSSENCIPKI